MKNTCRAMVATVVLGLSTPVLPRDLTGPWRLDVENRNHQVLASLVVEFTHQAASSCLGGGWLGVTIVSAATKDKDFFPVSGPLSYQVRGDEITLGRNDVCDGYLHMTGPLRERIVKGDYYRLGLGGSTPLGFFALAPMPPAPAVPVHD